MFGGLAIDFLIQEQHNNQATALDVALMGVKAEKEKFMRKFIVAIVVLVAVLSIVIVQPWSWPSVQNQLLLWRMNSAAKNMSRFHFSDLVTSSVIREAIQERQVNNGSLTYSSRKAVFDAHLCKPVFSDQHDDGKKCYNALYGANAGDSGNDNYLYKKFQIPVAIAPLIDNFRRAMMERVKTYLADPTRLKEFYFTHKGVILNELRPRSPRPREGNTRIEEIQEIRSTFYRYLSDPSVRKALDVSLDAERKWMNASSDLGHDMLYQQYQKSTHDLGLLANPDIVRFVARRYIEGGDELLLAYVAKRKSRHTLLC